MKRYTASQLRAHLSEALDEVERGGEVAVERGKQTFRIIPARPPANIRHRTLDFHLTDERLLDGWTWEWQGPGRPMKVRARAPRRRRRRA